MGTLFAACFGRLPHCFSSSRHIGKLMGAQTPGIDSAADVFNGCHSSLCKPVREETCNIHSSSKLGKTPRAIILEDVDTLSSGGYGCMTVEELEISLSGILHIEDSCEPFGNRVDSSHSDICKDEDMQSLFADTNTMTAEELEISLSGIVRIEDSCEPFGNNVDSNHSGVCKDKDMQSPFEDTNTSKSITVEELEISLSGILHIEDSCETFGNSLNSNHFDVCKEKDMQSNFVDTIISKSKTVEELEISLSGILHIEDSCETFGNSLDSNHSDVCNDKDMQSPFVDTSSSKCFSTSEAIACSEVVQSCSLNVDVIEGSSSTVIYIENSLMAKNPRNACLMNPPIAPKIISALKGSRSQQGINGTEKLSVKWAPDVYDPPVTSESHTVRGHSQRSKAKKDLYKHRHKGKSSRGSGSDKKHAHRRSTSSLIDPRISRLRALDLGSRSKGHGGTELSVLSYAARSRSSCYMEPVPCVHLSVTEAS